MFDLFFFMYDVIIVGGGPAGLTAGIYTARNKLKTLVLTKMVGGQMAWSNDIENYSGFAVTTGAELVQKFRDHVAGTGEDLELKENIEIVNIEKNFTSFELRDKTGMHYYAKAVIIATGKEPRLLGVPGEKEFYGKGVSTCATCDAPLYKNRTVAVVGGGNSALDAIYALSKSAARIYSITVNKELLGEETLKQKVSALPNVTFLYNTRIVSILGGKQVKGINIRRGEGKEEYIAIDGVFIEIGYVTNLSFDHLTQKNHEQEVVVDKNLQTSIPGLFAAGDVNDAWGEQIVIAAGEGAKAAMAVAKYLHRS